MRNLHINVSLFLLMFFLTTTFAQTETPTLAEANTTSTLKSQKSTPLSDCQTDRKEATFVRQKDLAGQDIEAFDLTTLRSNARYGLVEAYKEGFARIKDQVFGFLNACGDEIVPCQYQDAEPFNQGRALVKKVNWYFVDAKGEESNALKNVIQAKALIKGISIVYFQNGQCALVDNKFDESNAPISALYDEITAFCRQEVFKVKRNGKFGLINLAGKELMQTDFENIEECGLSNIFKVIKNGKVGLADTEWVVRVTPTFDKINEFDNNGLATATEGGGVRLVSNKTFKTSALYKTISGFDQNKLAQIQSTNGDFGLINTDLIVILEPQYREIGEFNKFGLASACRFEQKCGFISLQGKEIIPPQYSAVGQFTHHGLVVVKDFKRM
ncbi:MAG: WG repeat-containing protein [Saprospiraceae bacterium]|nr:WG repeat-containing protein [Saprospiraceae bacterium]